MSWVEKTDEVTILGDQPELCPASTEYTVYSMLAGSVGLSLRSTE